MQQVTPQMLPGTDIPYPPTQDELPYDDGMPMPTFRHVLQMTLLMETLQLYWSDRPDVFIAGDMFVYFSPDQVRTGDFLGPDVFIVQGVARGDRKSWVVWNEGGRSPDVVFELLSESTAHEDKHHKKEIYRTRLRVPEYFWYDPYDSEDFAGFNLQDGEYVPIDPDVEGRLISRQTNLLLVRWQGEYRGQQATWLRWATPDGGLLPTGAELATVAQREAESERQRAEAERARADLAERRLAELEAQLAGLELPDDPSGGAPPGL